MSLIDGVRGYDNTVNEINLQDSDGNTALILASGRGYIEIVKLLLEHETINVNEKNNNGYAALIYASRNGNIEIVRLLLDIENINVNLQNKNGYTALILASWNGHIEVVKLLLNIEIININIQDNTGQTALVIASRKGNIDVVELLLSKGATVPLKNNYSKDINEVLTNWKIYLPRWNRFDTYKYYPKEFNDIVMLWLLICKRKNFVSKDIKLLMIEYLAESWKFENLFYIFIK